MTEKFHFFFNFNFKKIDESTNQNNAKIKWKNFILFEIKISLIKCYF
jgi:hypothetical protein